MKKVLLLGSFLISGIIFSQTMGGFDEGYVQGYYSVTKTKPTSIPTNLNWSATNLSTDTKFLSYERRGETLTNLDELQVKKEYSAGYKRGEMDGRNALSQSSEGTKKDGQKK
ncbi:hypothetical protein MTP09_00125 [Chryseobacterium suipulveris]|uniref:Uncharacterized protein n=1 Tax=Chryseobacterium suipulveris TaxID=2929800 RepID=A0ABY4BPG9_9FLAO|nr:hypothetical protein [Chryseobacterium suipulveris]UOE41088.1 hypothetical protein MTP09_00125 [Chryseobacterium suipulveris]